jgi:Family of unknown function (DUF6460)
LKPGLLHLPLRDITPTCSASSAARPGAVLVKLIFLSLLVGAFMALLGITPIGLYQRIVHLVRDVLDLGFDSVREVGRWILYGAIVVVPLWLVSRLFARGR